MKVRLCDDCPYSIGDIAQCFDPGAEYMLCACCPTESLPHAPKYKREPRRWQQREDTLANEWRMSPDAP